MSVVSWIVIGFVVIAIWDSLGSIGRAIVISVVLICLFAIPSITGVMPTVIVQDIVGMFGY